MSEIDAKQKWFNKEEIYSKPILNDYNHNIIVVIYFLNFPCRNSIFLWVWDLNQVIGYLSKDMK